MRHLLVWLGAAGLLASTAGCATIDRNRAEAHHKAAKEEAKDLNLGRAAKEERRASQARRDADRDRF